MTQQLQCPLDDRDAEEVDDGYFVHADDGTPLCADLPELVEEEALEYGVGVHRADRPEPTEDFSRANLPGDTPDNHAYTMATLVPFHEFYDSTTRVEVITRKRKTS